MYHFNLLVIFEELLSVYKLTLRKNRIKFKCLNCERIINEISDDVLTVITNVFLF